MEKTAVVTGASRGIGAAIATVCVSISVSLMNGICLKKEWRKINNPDIGTSE